MKTEQEQIEEIVKILLEASKKCFDADCDCCDKQYEKDCAQYNKAVALVQAGYVDVSEYKAEIEQLNEKLAKQTRIARDANAKFTGVEHYLRPFQYKADRLQTKCNDLKKLSDWQREEIKRLKEETSNIRKDTAKKILQTLYDQCYEINDETGESMGNFVSDDDILCLAKQYGVEVNV